MSTRFESWDEQVKAAREAQPQAESAKPPPVKAPMIPPPIAAAPTSSTLPRARSAATA